MTTRDTKSIRDMSKLCVGMVTAIVLFLAIARTSQAQDASPLRQGDSARTSVLSALPPAGPMQWQQLSRFSLSSDGKWLAYGVTIRGEPNSRQGVVVVQEVDGESQLFIEAPGGREALFSADSKSVVVATRGSNGTVVGVYELPTFNLMATFRNPRSLEVAYRKPEFILLHGCKEFVTSANGTVHLNDDELLVYSTVDHSARRHRKVRQFKPARDTRSIAIVADGETHGWELSVVDLASDDRVILEAGRGRIEGLSWSDDADSVAYIHSEDDADVAVVLWKRVGSPKPVRYVLDPKHFQGWPKGKTFAHDATLSIGDKGRLVGISLQDRSVRTKRPGVNSSDNKAPQIWRTSAPRLPTERDDTRAFERYLRNESRWDGLTHVWDSVRHKLVWLANSPEGGASVIDSKSIAYIRDQLPYAGFRSRGTFFYDMFVKDLASENKRIICKRAGGRLHPVVSPSGDHVVEHTDGGWKLHDIPAKTSHWLSIGTEQAPDRPIDTRSSIRAKWRSDGRTVLLNDGDDLWAVNVEQASSAERLTNGKSVGRRYTFLDEGEDGALYMLFTVNDSKHSGVSVLRGGKLVELIRCEGNCDDDNFDRADGRLAIQFEKHNVPANIAIIDESERTIVFETGLTAGESAADHTKRELITYRAPWNEPLHATLVYPADFRPERKYPMVVLVYKRESDEHHWFESAASNSYLSPASWASRGYFVLKPDMAARVGDPGRSAVKCLEAAMDAATQIDAVDMNRVAIIGASHGGYQMLMALCISDRFAAGVAVNPVTDLATHSVDLVEMHGETNLGSVLVDGRTQTPFWEDPESYVANSPLYLVKGMDTPLMLGVGKMDDNVNWRQSLYFFNALRALQKPAHMVLYPSAGHGFAFDQFRKRVDQFLDDSLKPQ